MGSPHMNLWADEPQVVSLCRGPSIHIPMWGIPTCLGAAIHISMMELPLLGRQLCCGILSHGGQLHCWVSPIQRYQIVITIYVGPQLRVDMSNLSLGNIPISCHFFAGPTSSRDQEFFTRRPAVFLPDHSQVFSGQIF